MEDNYTQLLINNEVGKIKHQVLTVLELAIPEIREYLSRSNPNVEDALWRLAQIEQMMKELTD